MSRLGRVARGCAAFSFLIVIVPGGVGGRELGGGARINPTPVEYALPAGTSTYPALEYDAVRS